MPPTIDTTSSAAQHMERDSSQASSSSAGSDTTAFGEDASLDKLWRDDKRIWIHSDHVESQHRTLVLCFDGTGDEFDSDVSVSWLLGSTLIAIS